MQAYNQLPKWKACGEACLATTTIIIISRQTEMYTNTHTKTRLKQEHATHGTHKTGREEYTNIGPGGRNWQSDWEVTHERTRRRNGGSRNNGTMETNGIRRRPRKHTAARVWKRMKRDERGGGTWEREREREGDRNSVNWS